jgi:hypothetical protein
VLGNVNPSCIVFGMEAIKVTAKTYKMKTATIFRKFHSGDIIALFPELPGGIYAHYCMSYQAIGQHGTSSVDISHCTTLAKPDEYADLLSELGRIGYDIKICQRITAKHNKARTEALAARLPHPY